MLPGTQDSSNITMSKRTQSSTDGGPALHGQRKERQCKAPGRPACRVTEGHPKHEMTSLQQGMMLMPRREPARIVWLNDPCMVSGAKSSLGETAHLWGAGRGAPSEADYNCPKHRHSSTKLWDCTLTRAGVGPRFGASQRQWMAAACSAAPAGPATSRYCPR